MSAINVVKQRSSVHLYADASVYDHDGVLRFIAPKTFALPHHPAVIATRGPNTSTHIIGSALAAAFSTFDEMVDGIENALPHIVAANSDRMSGGGHSRIEITMAGWSERDGGPLAFSIATEANEAGEAYRLLRIDGLYISPTLDHADIRAAIAAGKRFSDVEDMDVDAHGLMLMELQRARRIPLEPDGVPRHWVGGFCEITTVTREDVSQRLLHRWPDVVGLTIDPEPIAWPAWWASRADARPQVNVVKLSRHERRAAQARARK